MLIMTSWRDEATQQSQVDLDGLLNVTLPFAQQMLAKRGKFYPFGAAVTVKGETRLLADAPGQGEDPASGDVRASLHDGIRRKRAVVNAIAVCSDVWLVGSGAILVAFIHPHG